jgi:hypothetical protein
MTTNNETYKLRDDVDESLRFDEYYCANIVEGFFECKTKMTYQKGGGCGMNYKYCSNCYDKWNNNKRQTKCLIDINKL